MIIEDLIKKIKKLNDKTAFIWKEKSYSYAYLLIKIFEYDKILKNAKIPSGAVVAIISDFSPNCVALLISLIRNKNIIMPLTSINELHFDYFYDLANCRYSFVFDNHDNFKLKNNISNCEAPPILLKILSETSHSGLLLFTSGTTGKPKGIVHDFEKLLKKFQNANKSFRTITFLMFDHIAGIDTLFYILFSGGTMVLPEDREINYV